jgi:hypothetical protein
LRKMIGFSIKKFLFRACVRPLGVAALLVIYMLCVRLAGNPVNWFYLIFQGSLAGLGSVVVVFGVGITKEERHRFLVQPLERLRNKMRAALGVTGC